MNEVPGKSHPASEWQDAIDRICRAFERRWHADPAARIDEVLQEVPAPDESEFRRDLLAELIRVEMDLRHGVGTLNPFEFVNRFPEFETVIEEMADQLDRRDDRDRSVSQPMLVRTVLRQETRDGSPESQSFFVDAVNEHHAGEIPSRLGHYREICQISSGGFGVVCRAWDESANRAVALKFPRQDLVTNDQVLQMFRDEAHRAMQLSHAGIVTTWGVENIDGFFFIVQQLIEGTDLKAQIGLAHAREDVAALIATIADALAWAHLNGIVHRDLKPSNILIDRDGRPYIADFGLALHESDQLLLPNVVCGTVPYMSPQQVAGLTHNLDGRTDIWSLGVIMYELLARGRRPFRGYTRQQVFDQIETREPWPLRAIDPGIDGELQRICFRCLAKVVTQRYLTADELADDLRHWLKPSPAPVANEQPAATFVPVGLRSFGADEAAFFPQLLPGPRDRDGLPASIRFWKTRIDEPVASESRVATGVIYGPSGSGKSSFVKAGLIPNLASGVETVYVEATQADTEVRLIGALRERFPQIPDDHSLPELMLGLARGQWQAETGDKILIVLDQFEQRLSVADDFAQSQLALALRRCNGSKLQCLLLVRDDFWMALTRFADAVQMDLREGQNTQGIDLFDRPHARHVLVRLGHAFQRLPVDDPDRLSPAELAFVDEVIEQLAEDQHVICVRLTLFAEMFRARPWTLAELKSTGGVAGVGTKFLESTFGSESRNVRFRSRRAAVKRVLETLLPRSGSDIRGSMRAESELVAAAQLESRRSEFAELINMLDQELRLVTRTDPDITGDIPVHDPAARREGWYQLTHDYLVPSIRDWLDNELSRTRRGRARIRLRKLASQVVPGQKPENLPGNLEWLSWRLLIPRHSMTPRERQLMQYGQRQFLWSTGRLAAVVGVVAALISWLVISDRRQRVAANLVDNLLNQQISQVPAIVAELPAYEHYVRPQLQELSRHDTTPERASRVLLGLLPFDQSRVAGIVDMATRPDSSPEELVAAVSVLKNFNAEFEQLLSSSFDEVNGDPRCRFRAAVALGGMCDTPEIAWDTHAGLLASVLVREPVTSHSAWINLLAPIGENIEQRFEEILLESNDRGVALPLAMAIYRFSDANEIGRFASMIPAANDAVFDSLMRVFEEDNRSLAMAEALRQLRVEADDEQGIAARAVGLLRLGYPDEFRDLLADTSQPGVRSHAAILANSTRVGFGPLQGLYEAAPADDSFVRQELLLAFAERVATTYEDQYLSWLDDMAAQVCLEDDDSGCFSTAELIIRRRGGDVTEYRNRRRDRNQGSPKGNVLINSQLQAFAVFQNASGADRKYRFAVSVTELTEQQFHACPLFPHPSGNPTDMPLILDRGDLARVYQYCNWLSEQDAVPRSQWIYPDDAQPDLENLPNDENSPVNPARTGYRLMTIHEWLAVTDAQTQGSRFLGTGNGLSGRFAWTQENSGGNQNEVALLLPDSHGLFDIYGNGSEVCIGQPLRPLQESDDSGLIDMLQNLDRLGPLARPEYGPQLPLEFLAAGNWARQTRSRISATGAYGFNPNQGSTGILATVRIVRTIESSDITDQDLRH